MRHAPDTLAADSVAVCDTSGCVLVLPSARPAVRVPALTDCNAFADNGFCHVGLPMRNYGFEPTPVPFRLRNEGYVTPVLLLVCCMLAAAMLQRLKGKTADLLHAFFFPIAGKKEVPQVEDPLRFSTRLMSVVILSVSASLISFAILSPNVSVYPFPESPYVLLGAFLLFWPGYFLLKRLAVCFVNWVFFRSAKIFTYMRAYTLLMCFQSLLFLLLATLVIYLPLSSRETLVAALVAFALSKFLLLFKTYGIFFPKMYGALHLILYFCTLELLPLLVFQRFLVQTGWLVNMKL